MISRLAVLSMFGCAAGTGPELTSADPAAAGRGARVVLVGERLCGETANCETAAGEVQLGLSPPTVHANIIEYAADRATIEIPSLVDVGRTAIVVVVNEQSSNALDFEVLAPE